MKSFTSKDRRLPPVVRKYPYLHHPMGSMQRTQQAMIHRILHTTGVQTKSHADQITADNEPPSVTVGLQNQIQSLKGRGGQLLPASECKYFESRFGANFSNVRLHTDSRSAHTARSINARAFTIGNDVIFGNGEYVPGTNSSRRLLAHELTHVVQQSGIKSLNRKRSYPASRQYSYRNPIIRYSTVRNYIARIPDDIALERALHLAETTGEVTVPALSQYALGTGYWQKVFRRYLREAIGLATPHQIISMYVYAFRRKANILVNRLGQVIKNKVKYPYPQLYDFMVTNKKRAAYYISVREYKRRLRQIYPHFRSIQVALLSAARHEGVSKRGIAQLNRNLNRHWWKFKDFWKASGQYACAKAAARIVNLERKRGTKMAYKALHLWKTPQKINDMVDWYKNARSKLCPGFQVPASYASQPHNWRPYPLYKGHQRKHTHNIKYNSAMLKRGARAIIYSIDSGVPVHTRVLSGYIHKQKLKAIHSIVIHKYKITGTKVNPSKVDFTAIDVDGGATITVKMDMGATGCRFEYNPGDICWYKTTTNSWDYDRKTAKPPWRYQIMAIRPTRLAWRKAGRKS